MDHYRSISYFRILVTSTGQSRWKTRWLLMTIPLLLPLLLVTLFPAPVTCAAHPTQPQQATLTANNAHLEHQQQLQQLKHSRLQQQLQPQSPHQLQTSTSVQIHPRVLPAGQQPSTTQLHAQQSNMNYMNSLSANMNPYTNATHMLLLDLRQQLITRALKFDEHFRSLLTKSKVSLHNMFSDTYGVLYQHNTDIFISMYEGLEQYYATGRIKLTKFMESFFERLYQKIFQVVNSNRAFTPNYLECATEQLAQLKPFKDVPDKLIGELRHTFVAARTFNQALNSGIDIIKSIISLGQPSQCTNLISEKLLKQRPVEGSGALSAPRAPCLGFCEQVISRCIGRANLEPLNDRWKTYVVSLNDLAKKLSVQYNIDTTIGPIDVPISEAIMNFQENAQNITSQVFQACGRATMQEASLNQIKPVPNRLGKRAASVAQPLVLPPNIPHSSSLPLSSSSSSSNLMVVNSARRNQQAASLAGSGQFGRNPLAAPQMQTLAPAPTLAPTMGLYGPSDDATASLMSISERSPIIINDIRNYLLSTKYFWSNLPNSVCTSTNYTAGAGVAPVNPNQAQNQNYLRKQVPACFQEQLSLSDMNSDLRYRIEIQQQVNRLEAINAKIADALRGVEIDWTTSTPATAPVPGGADLMRQQQQQLQPQAPQSSVVVVAPPSPSPPLPATVATGEPSELAEDEEPEEDHEIEGSGDAPEDEVDDEYTSAKPDNEEIDSNEDDEETHDESPASADPEITSPSDMLLPETTEKPGLADLDQKPSLDTISNDLITASDANAQKSSASDNSVAQIVIQNQVQLVFGLFIACALSIINSFHNNNHQVLSRRQCHH